MQGYVAGRAGKRILIKHGSIKPIDEWLWIASQQIAEGLTTASGAEHDAFARPQNDFGDCVARFQGDDSFQQRATTCEGGQGIAGKAGRVERTDQQLDNGAIRLIAGVGRKQAHECSACGRRKVLKLSMLAINPPTRLQRRDVAREPGPHQRRERRDRSRVGRVADHA